jgi:hypothetical protein
MSHRLFAALAGGPKRLCPLARAQSVCFAASVRPLIAAGGCQAYFFFAAFFLAFFFAFAMLALQLSG